MSKCVQGGSKGSCTICSVCEWGGGEVATPLHQIWIGNQYLNRSYLSFWWSRSWSSAIFSWERVVEECVRSFLMLENLSCVGRSKCPQWWTRCFPQFSVRPLTLYRTFISCHRPAATHRCRSTFSLPPTCWRRSEQNLFFLHNLLSVVRLITVDEASGHCWVCVIHKFHNMTARPFWWAVICEQGAQKGAQYTVLGGNQFWWGKRWHSWTLTDCGLSIWKSKPSFKVRSSVQAWRVFGPMSALWCRKQT